MLVAPWSLGISDSYGLDDGKMKKICVFKCVEILYLTGIGMLTDTITIAGYSSFEFQSGI